MTQRIKADDDNTVDGLPADKQFQNDGGDEISA